MTTHYVPKSVDLLNLECTQRRRRLKQGARKDVASACFRSAKKNDDQQWSSHLTITSFKHTHTYTHVKIRSA